MILQKWNSLPKFIRFYLCAGMALIIFFSLCYLYLSPNDWGSNALKQDSPKTIIQSNNINVENVMQVPNDAIELRTSSYDKKEVIKQKLSLKKTLLKAEDFYEASKKQNDIQARIQGAILHSWNGYRNYSWGYDHLKPLSRKGDNWFEIGLTILDSLDTLIMAGLEKEYNQGLDWVQNDLTFVVNRDVNCFETTIRALGKFYA